MSAISRPGPPDQMSRLTPFRGGPVPHCNDPVQSAAGNDELLLCGVLEALVTLEGRFGAALGTAGLRKLRQAFEALGEVYCAQAVDRISRDSQ
jgi:hypothetical protein